MSPSVGGNFDHPMNQMKRHALSLSLFALAATAHAQAPVEIPVPETQEKTLSIMELMLSGGIAGQLIMLSLLLLSVVAVYIFVERVLALKRASQEETAFMNQLKDMVQGGRLDAARQLCQRTDTPVARMMEKGIARIGRPLNDINAAVENVGKLEVSKLEANLPTLATVAGAAPMIGFLGTVVGMILAFHEMAAAGGQINVSMLANGIYTAMTTTVAGLVVGIMAYLGYNFLVARINRVVFNLESRTTEFIDLLHEPA